MEDRSLRTEFRRALDAVAPPAPWLAPRVREELRRRRREGLDQRAPRGPSLAWLLPAIAVLLAIAIVVTLVIGSRLLGQRTVPSKPGPAAGLTCSTWGFIPGGGGAPASIKMTSVTTGWAAGDLRTADGGAHWHDVSPNELRSGEPFLPGQQTVYPPSYTDFFLDANHAWLARSYDSSTACIDHIKIFMTTDGGQTWRSSVSIAPHLRSGEQPQLVLDFVDPQHGWLMISEAAPKPSLIYRTDNGGQSWGLISKSGPRCMVMVFSSTKTGWSSCTSPNSGGAGLLVTQDGGVTWNNQPSSPPGLAAPVFFDGMHGAAVLYDNNGEGIYTTSDGGFSWHQTAFAPGGTAFAPGGFEPYAAIVGFQDATNFWMFATQPAWAKGGISTDWLYHSADGGVTWKLVQRDTPVGFPVNIDFVDPQHGFVLQTDQNGAPQVLVTSDGGHAWTTIQAQVS